MKNKKKVLFVATVSSHIRGFHTPYLKMFKEKGYEVYVAAKNNLPKGEKLQYCDRFVEIPFSRSPYSTDNLKAIKHMKTLLKKERFDIIHCHTPMGAVVTRLAARKARKNGTRVIYTAHGFHFYKGAPLLNWMLFYPVEKYLAKYTDTLITINNEDYERAKNKFNKRCHDIQYVPGVGVDPKKFDFKMTKQEKHDLRASLGLRDDDFVMIFPAELSKRKNQLWLINTLKPLFNEHPEMHLLLPGSDKLNGKCQKLAKKLGLEKQVHFLGFRKDISKLLKISNLAVSSSKQEGLPVNILEAKMTGLPVVVLGCRGMRDILDGDETSKIIRLNDEEGFKKGILLFRNNDKNRAMLMMDDYVIDCVKQKMSFIYNGAKK